MSSLYQFNFPAHLQMQRVFENGPLLQEMAASSAQQCTLPVVDEKYGEMRLPRAPTARPYTYCSLVSTLDGRIAYENDPVSTYIARDNYLDKDGGLLNFWSLMMQRTHADAIITAAKTLQSEPEGTLHICDETLLAQRQSLPGILSAQPLNIVISRSGQGIPFGHKIFHSRGQGLRCVLVTSAAGAAQLKKQPEMDFAFWHLPDEQTLHAQTGALRAALWEGREPGFPVLVPGGPQGGIDTELLMLALRTLGVQRLFIESPQYMYHLMNRQMLDEFFMDFSLVFAGGGIVAGKGHEYTSHCHPHTSLVCAAVHSSHFLYTRHKMVYGAGPGSQQ